MMADDKNDLNIIALNCNGYKANCVYIKKLIKSYNVIHLTETWLTDMESHLLEPYKKDFHIIIQPGNCHQFGRPFGGTALLLQKSIFDNINTVIKEDFITIAKVHFKNNLLLIGGVYLQSLNSQTNQCLCIETYNSQLSSIAGIIRQFTDSADPIFIGDFQCCPDQPTTPRTAQPNALSKHLSIFMRDNNLIPIDITQGEGPTYTYHHHSLPNNSYIDHILVPPSLSTFVKTTSVLLPDATNTGDHLPVDVKITLPTCTQPRVIDNPDTETPEFIPNFMWSNKKFTTNYRDRVSHLIKNTSKKDTESMIQELHNILRTAATDCYTSVNKTQYNFTPKSWWNNEIGKAHRNLKTMFNKWRDNGFPRSVSDVTYNRYQFARKMFRNLVKRSKHQETVDHYISVEKIKKIKPTSYWKQINYLKKGPRKLYTINNKTTDSDITTDFGDHFDTLLNTPRVENIDNSATNDKLKDLLTSIQQSFQEDKFYITKTEVSNALKNLNCGKSRDPFQIKAEHYLHAKSDIFIDYLTELINKILTTKKLPDLLSTSIIIPLLKSHKKPLNDANSYRGISILPIITKILELVILERCPTIHSHIESQFGFTSGASTLHAELIMQDTINYFNNNGTPVYVCSLDGEKAFDSCNWFFLFEKLCKKDIPNEIISFLIQLYMKGTASVHYGSAKSNSFSLTQGVRQGAILSPYFYNIYIEDLISNIKSLNIGTVLPGDLQTCIIVYADDIILLSPTLKHLQTLVTYCEDFGHEHGIKFNHSKSKTQFVISGKSQLPTPTLTLNNTEIFPQETLSHLGFQWAKKRNKLCLQQHKTSRIAELWSVTTSLIASGIRHCHPNTIVSLYNTLVIPKLLYGLELVDLSKSEQDNLNTQARSSLKSLFNISKKSKNHINRIYNIPDVCITLEKRKLKLINQLLTNKTTRKYTCYLLCTPAPNSSFISKSKDIIAKNNINMTDILSNKFTITQVSQPIDSVILDRCRHCITNWHILDNRTTFKAILEEHVQRARAER